MVEQGRIALDDPSVRPNALIAGSTTALVSVRQDVSGIEQLGVAQPAHRALLAVRAKDEIAEPLLMEPLLDVACHVRLARLILVCVCRRYLVCRRPAHKRHGGL